MVKARGKHEPEGDPKMSKKAKRIFDNMMAHAREAVSLYGRVRCDKENLMVKFDTTGTDHRICNRTIDDILKIRQRNVDHTYTDQTLGIISWSQMMDEREALNIVLRTVVAASC